MVFDMLGNGFPGTLFAQILNISRCLSVFVFAIFSRIIMPELQMIVVSVSS